MSSETRLSYKEGGDLANLSIQIDLALQLDQTVKDKHGTLTTSDMNRIIRQLEQATLMVRRMLFKSDPDVSHAQEIELVKVAYDVTAKSKLSAVWYGQVSTDLEPTRASVTFPADYIGPRSEATITMGSRSDEQIKLLAKQFANCQILVFERGWSRNVVMELVPITDEGKFLESTVTRTGNVLVVRS